MSPGTWPSRSSTASAPRSTSGRSLLTAPGAVWWLRAVEWSVAQCVLDGELCADTGQEGILGVFEARQSRTAPLAFIAFDLLQVNGQEVMREPWADRRKRLEDLGTGLRVGHVGLVPVTDNADQLWHAWVDQGGEGIVLKDRRAPYRPGMRSREWLKVKARHTLRVRVEAGDPTLVRWGEWGWAARLTLTYRHPQTHRRIRIDEVVHVPDPEAFALRPRHVARVECWGFLPNGRLRHPLWLGWTPRPDLRHELADGLDTPRGAEGTS
jgi:ATP dependent DNA ligase domain